MPHISATTDAAAECELQSAGFDLLTGKRYEKGEIKNERFNWKSEMERSRSSKGRVETTVLR
jgi:hypothetical protein